MERLKTYTKSSTKTLGHSGKTCPTGAERDIITRFGPVRVFHYRDVAQVSVNGNFLLLSSFWISLVIFDFSKPFITMSLNGFPDTTQRSSPIVENKWNIVINFRLFLRDNEQLQVYNPGKKSQAHEGWTWSF